jgi:hypothetical protein
MRVLCASIAKHKAYLSETILYSAVAVQVRAEAAELNLTCRVLCASTTKHITSIYVICPAETNLVSCNPLYNIVLCSHVQVRAEAAELEELRELKKDIERKEKQQAAIIENQVRLGAACLNTT